MGNSEERVGLCSPYDPPSSCECQLNIIFYEQNNDINTSYSASINHNWCFLFFCCKLLSYRVTFCSLKWFGSQYDPTQEMIKLNFVRFIKRINYHFNAKMLNMNIESVMDIILNQLKWAATIKPTQNYLHMFKRCILFGVVVIIEIQCRLWFYCNT